MSIRETLQHVKSVYLPTLHGQSVNSRNLVIEFDKASPISPDAAGLHKLLGQLGDKHGLGKPVAINAYNRDTSFYGFVAHYDPSKPSANVEKLRNEFEALMKQQGNAGSAPRPQVAAPSAAPATIPLKPA